MGAARVTALVAGLAVCLLGSALLVAPRLRATTALVEDQSEFFASEKEYSAVHPVYTR
jgi:uncharacterized membrane protein YhhN